MVCVAIRVAPASADLQRWTPIPASSEVAFVASFPLGNFTGRTREVSGEFHGDPSDLRRGVRGVLHVKSAGLRTGDDARDREMLKTLAVDRYPEIRFTVEQVDASFPSPSDRADVLLTISGVMLIRGVERPMTFPGRLRLRDDKLWVRGEAELRLSDFGVRPPSRLFLDVGERLLASFDLLLVPRPQP
jgi:polyisoprenoid-binding protein YceI